jgi:hypothetical protein
MSALRLISADGLMLLRGVVKRPIDYGLDHPHESLKNVLEFAIRHPDCVQEGGANASREINYCLKESPHEKAEAWRVQHRIQHQLLLAKDGLAWTELDHRLGVKSHFWNVGRYSRLAKGLCVLAGLWRYRTRHFPRVAPYSSNAAAARLARLWQLRQRGWTAVQEHLGRCGVDWQAGVAAHLGAKANPCCATAGGTQETVRQDRNGNFWIVKYSPESLMNPVLASIFARLSGCPGTEICPSFLDYDPRNEKPCSVQPYITARTVPRFDSLSREDLIHLIGGSRRCASQLLCQAVTQWIVENTYGNRIIIDKLGNCISIDQDRSFFIEDQRVATNWPAAWDARSKTGISVVRAELIEATARIPGVLDDLAAFVARVEAIPASVYAGLVRNASFREEQLCSLFYLDTMDSHALDAVEALERWIAHLLARKLMLRAALLRRLGAVLGTTVRL